MHKLARTQSTMTKQANRKKHTKTTIDTQQEKHPNEEYRNPTIKAITFGTRGMPNTILDLHHIINIPSKLILMYLSETKHNYIESIWRNTLEENTLFYTSPKLDPVTNRRSTCTILVASRDTLKTDHHPRTLKPHRPHYSSHAHTTWRLTHHSRLNIHATTTI